MTTAIQLWERIKHLKPVPPLPDQEPVFEGVFFLSEDEPMPIDPDIWEEWIEEIIELDRWERATDYY